jgi:hypothetical protein
MTSRDDDTGAGADLEAEFDVLTGRLGIEVPPDLKGGVLRGYRGLRAMTVLLRGVDVGSPVRTDDGKETPGG